ncbi:hypothetical protein HNR42_003611, partial [Deinobacterium chartae]|nr:hypothetical protein [Deinobacterium chartae]
EFGHVLSGGILEEEVAVTLEKPERNDDLPGIGLTPKLS